MYNKVPKVQRKNLIKFCDLTKYQSINFWNFTKHLINFDQALGPKILIFNINFN